MTLILCGDVPGHIFRGNQHVTADRQSTAAGSASRKAKRAEKHGDAKEQKSAHRGAHYAHLAAIENTKGKTRGYHKKMAAFHGKRAGVRLDSAVLDKADETVLQKSGASKQATRGPVNVFKEGDKVVGLDDNKDYTVTGQRGYRVSVKGRSDWVHANRLKLASGKKPETVILDDAAIAAMLDDAAGGLFGDGDSGYIKGTISRNGLHVADVHLREDGMALFALSPVLNDATGYSERTLETMREEIEGGWRGDIGEAVQNLALATEDIEDPTQTDDQRRAAEERAEAERAAVREASEAARDAVLAAATSFGQGKPGFVAAIPYTGSGAVKDALARKPAGSFVFLVSDQTDGTWGVAMFARQPLGKGGRGIDPAGKVGNIQATAVMKTAAEAYAKGIENLKGAGGVVLGGDEEPAGKAFTVKGVDFEAVRFTVPIPHWRLKIVETVEVWQPGTGGIKGESVPKLIASVEDLAARSKTDAEWRFNLGLPKLETKPEIIERIDGDDGMYVNIVASTNGKGGFNAVLRDGDSEETVTATVNIQTIEAARERANEMLTGTKKPAATRYRYALVNRPAMIGGLPSKLEYTVEPRPAKGQPHYEMARHGILVTERELTEAELKSFELAPLVDGADLAQLADKVAESMAENASGHLEMAAEEPNYLRQQIMQTAERSDSGISYSIGDPALLVQMVQDKLKAMIPANAPQPEPTPPPVVTDTKRADGMALLTQVSAGTHPDMLEPELAEQIEAVMLAYPDDAELQALAERAINAYSDGLMAATKNL